MSGETSASLAQLLPYGASLGANGHDLRHPVPRQERTVTMLMLGRLNRAGRDTICRIRNVSEGGMRIDTASPLSEGELVAVEARSGVSIEGRIAWANHLSAGIAFVRVVDRNELVSPPIGPSGARTASRSPRFQASASARLQIDGRVIQTRVVDISLGGCRVESNAAFPRQVEGYISLPGLGQLACVSRWTTGNRAGLAFVTRPDFAHFANWLESGNLRFTDALAAAGAVKAHAPPQRPATTSAPNPALAFSVPPVLPFSRPRSF